MVTVLNVELTLDQLLGAIRKLDVLAKVRIAEVLAETQMETELARLIHDLAKTPPCDDITDANIHEEIKAVRNANG